MHWAKLLKWFRVMSQNSKRQANKNSYALRSSLCQTTTSRMRIFCVPKSLRGLHLWRLQSSSQQESVKTFWFYKLASKHDVIFHCLTSKSLIVSEMSALKLFCDECFSAKQHWILFFFHLLQWQIKTKGKSSLKNHSIIVLTHPSRMNLRSGLHRLKNQNLLCPISTWQSPKHICLHFGRIFPLSFNSSDSQTCTTAIPSIFENTVDSHAHTTKHGTATLHYEKPGMKLCLQEILSSWSFCWEKRTKKSSI